MKLSLSLSSIMQSIDHPRAPAARGIVRMDVFWVHVALAHHPLPARLGAPGLRDGAAAP